MYGQALPVVIDGEICSIDKERFINKMEEWNVKLETVRKVNEKDFMNFNPQKTGFAMLIPKEEMEGEPINE